MKFYILLKVLMNLLENYFLKEIETLDVGSG